MNGIATVLSGVGAQRSVANLVPREASQTPSRDEYLGSAPAADNSSLVQPDLSLMRPRKIASASLPKADAQGNYGPGGRNDYHAHWGVTDPEGLNVRLAPSSAEWNPWYSPATEDPNSWPVALTVPAGETLTAVGGNLNNTAFYAQEGRKENWLAVKLGKDGEQIGFVRANEKYLKPQTTERLPEADAQGNYSAHGGKRGTYHESWTVVDKGGLNLRQHDQSGSWNPWYGESNQDPTSWKAVAQLPQGTALKSVGGNLGNDSVYVQDGVGKPWMEVAVVNADGTPSGLVGWVRANEKFIMPE
jgi:hypothetical protein